MGCYTSEGGEGGGGRWGVTLVSPSRLLPPEIFAKSGGDGLRLTSYEGGTSILRRSAMADITPPMFSAAPDDSVIVTDTCPHIHGNRSSACVCQQDVGGK